MHCLAVVVHMLKGQGDIDLDEIHRAGVASSCCERQSFVEPCHCLVQATHLKVHAANIVETRLLAHRF